MKKLIFFLLVLLTLSHPLYSKSIVTFKNGRIVEGEIAEQTDEFVKVMFEGITITCWLDEVESIVSEDGTLFKPQVMSAQVSVQDEFIQSQETPESVYYNQNQVSYEDKNESESDSLNRSQQTSRVEIDPELSEDDPALDSTSRSLKKTELLLSPEETKIKKLEERIKLLFNILNYIVWGYCLMRIAINLRVVNPWWSWIPFLNFVLTCDVAERPRKWAYSVLAAVFGMLVFLFISQIFIFMGFYSFILITLMVLPLFIVAIFSLVIFIRLWISIVDRLGISRWLVILLFVPLFNYFFLFYLARIKVD